MDDKLVTEDGWPLVALNDDGIRVLGGPDACNYCGAKIGQPHGHKCVIVTKRVRLAYTFEVDVMIPHHWTEEDVLFHRNESSWCADNAITEIETYVGDGDKGTSCLCSRFTATFVKVLDETPCRELRDKHHENGKPEVVNG